MSLDTCNILGSQRLLFCSLHQHGVDELKPEHVCCHCSSKLLLEGTEYEISDTARMLAVTRPMGCFLVLVDYVWWESNFICIDLGANLPWHGALFCVTIFSVSRGQALSAELWCPKQRCSSSVGGMSSQADPPCACHFVRACTTGSPCWIPLLYVPMCRAYTYPCEVGFSVLASHWTASLLLHSVCQWAVI